MPEELYRSISFSDLRAYDSDIRKALRIVGGLDEQFETPSLQVADLCLRVKQAGFRVLQASAPTVMRKARLAAGARAGDQQYYVHARDRIRLKLLNLSPTWLAISVLFEVFTILPAALQNRVGLLWRAWWHSLAQLRELLALRRQRTRRVSKCL